MAVVIAIGMPIGLSDRIPGRVSGAEGPGASKGPIRIRGVEVSVWIVNPIGIGSLIIESVVPTIGSLDAGGAPISNAISDGNLRSWTGKDGGGDVRAVGAVGVRTIGAERVESKLDRITHKDTGDVNHGVDACPIVKGDSM